LHLNNNNNNSAAIIAHSSNKKNKNNNDNVNGNDNDDTINSDFEYIPVLVIRTRSNSIFSSEDDVMMYDLMPIANANYDDSNHSTLYDEWNRYGILPTPTRLVMFNPSLCNLCGIVDDNVDHCEYNTSYIHDHLGYNYCTPCKDKFKRAIKKRAEPIWDLLNTQSISYFWAPRTRRHSVTNQRIYSGPYTYEKWKAVSTYVSYITDNTKGTPGVENTPFIYCTLFNIYEDDLNKLISVFDILKSNYNACKDGTYDTLYDPNIDDPINTLELADDSKIVLHS
jgi:hypothetical protein